MPFSLIMQLKSPGWFQFNWVTLLAKYSLHRYRMQKYILLITLLCSLVTLHNKRPHNGLKSCQSAGNLFAARVCANCQLVCRLGATVQLQRGMEKKSAIYLIENCLRCQQQLSWMQQLRPRQQLKRQILKCQRQGTVRQNHQHF